MLNKVGSASMVDEKKVILFMMQSHFKYYYRGIFMLLGRPC